MADAKLNQLVIPLRLNKVLTQHIALHQEADQRSEVSRAHKRFPVGFDKRVTIEFERSDGRVVADAILRDISVGGAGLWIGTFIHPETRCWLMLGPRQAPELEIEGKVRWCKHFAHSVHEVGVQLNDVNPELLDATLSDQVGQPEGNLADAATMILAVLSQLRAKAETGLTSEETISLVAQLEPCVKAVMSAGRRKD